MTSSPPPSRHPRLTGCAALAAAALVGGALLTACGAGSDTGGAPADGLDVVASTTVYADIAEQVTGGNATVTAVISDPTADPHSYEASPADAAAVAAADLVVYNGGGYDAFVDRALGAADRVPVVRAVDEFARVTGQTPPGHSAGEGDPHAHPHDDHASDANEHVWFSPATAAAVAERLADDLASIDPGHAEQYHGNARRFADELAPLGARLDAIRDRGRFAYAQTERIGAHLFDAAGMVDRTPRGFLSSIEDDTDPSAADLAATRDLVTERRVAFLAFNTQTETPVTARLRDAAEQSGLAVVDLAETLPEGTSYRTWITGVVDSVTAALDGATPAAAPADTPATDDGH